MKTVELEFGLDDTVYYVFSPRQIITGKVYAITIDKDGILYGITHINGYGSSRGWNLNNGNKGVYGTEEEAIIACKEWAKRSNLPSFIS